LTDAPSKTQIVQARLAVGLLVGLIVGGTLWYGITAESLGRLWSDILDRPGGPMTFRFILQRDPQGRSGRLWEGFVSTARIIILGLIMDTVYQWVVFKTFYPVQAAVIAILLAFVPYLVLRGPIERIAYHWIARPASS